MVSDQYGLQNGNTRMPHQELHHMNVTLGSETQEVLRSFPDKVLLQQGPSSTRYCLEKVLSLFI